MKLSMKWLCDYIPYMGTVKEFIDGKQIIKEIYVPGKIINIVAK